MGRQGGFLANSLVLLWSQQFLHGFRSLRFRSPGQTGERMSADDTCSARNPSTEKARAEGKKMFHEAPAPQPAADAHFVKHAALALSPAGRKLEWQLAVVARQMPAAITGAGGLVAANGAVRGACTGGDADARGLHERQAATCPKRLRTVIPGVPGAVRFAPAPERGPCRPDCFGRSANRAGSARRTHLVQSTR